MAGQAFWESFMQLLAVRPDMAEAALRNISMFAVAADTTDLAMLAGCGGPLAVNLLMAGAACFGV